jgi:hypothetical protein
MLWEPKIRPRVLPAIIPHPRPATRLVRQVSDLRLHLPARDVVASWISHTLSNPGPHNRHHSRILHLCRWLRSYTAPLDHHSLPSDFGVWHRSHSVVYREPGLARPLCSGSGFGRPHGNLHLALRRYHHALDSVWHPPIWFMLFLGLLSPQGGSHVFFWIQMALGNFRVVYWTWCMIRSQCRKLAESSGMVTVLEYHGDVDSFHGSG